MENRKRKSNDTARENESNCGNTSGDNTRVPLSTSPVMNGAKKTRCSPAHVQWDISVDDAKAVFAELKVNFLPPKPRPSSPASSGVLCTNTSVSSGAVTPERRIESEKENRDSGYNSIPAPVLARVAANSGLTPSLASFMIDSPHYGLKRVMFGRKVKNRKELVVKKTSIEDLSNEMLLKIFSFLPWKAVRTRCSVVNQRWYNVSKERSLNLLDALDLKNRTLTTRQLVSALSTGARNVRFAGLTIPDPTAFITESRTFLLQNLDLSMANITIDQLNGILRGNEDGVSLIRLSLENLKINEETLNILRRKHPKLQILNLASCRVDNDGKSLDDTSFPSEITELNLSWIEGFPISLVICDLGRNLERLNLSGMRNLMNSDVMILVRRCPGLIELDVSDCEQLTSMALIKIKEGLKNLRSLNISRNYFMDNWLSLVLQIKSLDTISIFGLRRPDVLVETPFMISTSPISTIARPTVGGRRSTIWGIKVYHEESEQ